MSGELFKENVKRWSESFPDQAKILSSLKCENVQLITNPDGTLNLKVRVKDQEFLCHAESDPEEEARAWASKIKIGNNHVLIIWGLGLGYIYEAVLGWLKQDHKRALVFIEPNLEVIHRFFETERAKSLLFDKQVWIYHSEPNSPVIDDIVQAFIDKRCYVAVLSAYSRYLNEDLKCFQARFSYFFGMRSSINSEHKFMGAAFFRNFFKDLFFLPSSKFAEKMKGAFKDVPAIIVGAGPSVAKQLPLLKKIRNKALIFGGGTAVNALDTANILPHFGVGLDPNMTHFTRLIMNRAFETPYFYKNRIFTEALGLIHGDRIFLNGCGGYPVATWIENELGIPGQNNEEGFNVINLAVSTAKFLGCNPIITIGMDLAYTDGESYPPGILIHPIHSSKDHLRTKSADDELVVKPDIYGKPTVTLWKWVSEAFWYTEFAEKNPDIHLINCTEGGIGFPKIPNVTFQDVVGHVMTNEYDLDTWIAGVIESASMPPELTVEKVHELLTKLHDQLKHCAEVCEIVIKDCKKIFTDIKNGVKVPQMLLSKETIALLAQLEEEPVITELIRNYRQNYLDATKEQRKRIDLNAAFCTKEELLLKKVAQNQTLYDYLKTTSNSIALNIQAALSDYDDNKSNVAAAPSNESKSAINIIRNLKTELSDPSFEVIEKKYPNGKLMFRQFLKNQLLSGPSTAYDAEGHLLAWAHFEEGDKQGIAYSFYADSQLKSQTTYKKGQFDGKQLYYYSNGTLKSEISYRDGFLDGDVKLYYPSGKLQRELYFKNGMRVGTERLWNEIGLLIIEANFKDNMPFGTSRMWYNDGNIAIESTYGPNVGRPVIRFWDKKGSLVPQEEVSPDYFQTVGKRTGILTNSINDVVEQVKTLAPLVEHVESNETKSKDTSHSKELENDLKEVTNALDTFKNISKLVEITYGSDESSDKEIIWKTPMSRKILESQIEGMTKAVSGDLSKVHSALKDTIEKLSKKNKKETKGKSTDDPSPKV